MNVGSIHKTEYDSRCRNTQAIHTLMHISIIAYIINNVKPYIYFRCMAILHLHILSKERRIKIYTDYGYIGAIDGIEYATDEEAWEANPKN